MQLVLIECTHRLQASGALDGTAPKHLTLLADYVRTQ